MHEFITDGKEFYVSFQTDLVTGYIPVPIPKGEPILYWSGPKIDYIQSWLPALRFMIDHAEHETVLRLFMPRDRREILILPLSQIYGTGMSVKEDITEEERSWWAAEGMIEAGSMHSHCTSTAFQSGTDHDDEKNRDGLHLTIGKLRSSRLDLHARMTWTIPGQEQDGKVVRAAKSVTQKPWLHDWFLLPDHVEEFIRQEEELEDEIIRYILTKPPSANVIYPLEWLDKLKKASPPPTRVYPPGQGYLPGGGYDFTMGVTSSRDELPERIKKKDPDEIQEKDPEKFANPTQLKQALIWDLWSEILGLIADYPELRQAQVAVGDFLPHRRGALFAQHHAAVICWEQIKRILAGNNITETEFFEEMEPQS